MNKSYGWEKKDNLERDYQFTLSIYYSIVNLKK